MKRYTWDPRQFPASAFSIPSWPSQNRKGPPGRWETLFPWKVVYFAVSQGKGVLCEWFAWNLSVQDCWQCAENSLHCVLTSFSKGGCRGARQLPFLFQLVQPWVEFSSMPQPTSFCPIATTQALAPGTSKLWVCLEGSFPKQRLKRLLSVTAALNAVAC